MSFKLMLVFFITILLQLHLYGIDDSLRRQITIQSILLLSKNETGSEYKNVEELKRNKISITVDKIDEGNFDKSKVYFVKAVFTGYTMPAKSYIIIYDIVLNKPNLLFYQGFDGTDISYLVKDVDKDGDDELFICSDINLDEWVATIQLIKLGNKNYVDLIKDSNTGFAYFLCDTNDDNIDEIISIKPDNVDKYDMSNIKINNMFILSEGSDGYYHIDNNTGNIGKTLYNLLLSTLDEENFSKTNFSDTSQLLLLIKAVKKYYEGPVDISRIQGLIENLYNKGYKNESVISCMGWKNNLKAIPLLKKIINTTDEIFIKLAAIDALAEISEDDISEFLLEILDKEVVSQKKYKFDIEFWNLSCKEIVNVLRAKGDKRGLDLIVKIAGSSKYETNKRIKIIDKLIIRFFYSESKEELIRIMGNDKNEKIREFVRLKIK